MTSRVVLLYLLMLVCQIAHVFEEIWGRFWLMNTFRSLGLFLLANWVLFCIPVALFYFVLCERRWAYHLSMIYAGIMILNGLGHNVGRGNWEIFRWLCRRIYRNRACARGAGDDILPMQRDA
jgi:hypothetical protein